MLKAPQNRVRMRIPGLLGGKHQGWGSLSPVPSKSRVWMLLAAARTKHSTRDKAKGKSETNKAEENTNPKQNQPKQTKQLHKHRILQGGTCTLAHCWGLAGTLNPISFPSLPCPSAPSLAWTPQGQFQPSQGFPFHTQTLPAEAPWVCDLSALDGWKITIM